MCSQRDWGINNHRNAKGREEKGFESIRIIGKTGTLETSSGTGRKWQIEKLRRRRTGSNIGKDKTPGAQRSRRMGRKFTRGMIEGRDNGRPRLKW